MRVRQESELLKTRVQVVPTEFRLMPLYVQIYYTWLYAILMAVGPLALLIVNLLAAYYKTIMLPCRFSIR